MKSDDIKLRIAKLGIFQLESNMLMHELMPKLLGDSDFTHNQISNLRMVKELVTKEKNIVDEIMELMEKEEYAYIVILEVFGKKQMVECSDKEACLDMTEAFHGDDGKAYIFTNDLTVGGRDEKTGGTIICTSYEDAKRKAEVMLGNQE